MTDRSPRLDHSHGRVAGLVTPASAIVAVLLPVLLELADPQRTLFFALSGVSLALLVLLAVLYAVVKRDFARAALMAAGAVFVLVMAWFGAPAASEEAEGSPTSPTPGGPVVVEEPDEARALFDRALVGPTPWYNDVLAFFDDGTTDDIAAEAALSGAWWGLADWCIRKDHGSVGRCYDLAALYVLDYFERDPRTINSETWYGGGTVGSVAIESYELTADHLSLRVKSPYIPDLIKDRPGIDWECEPSCTAGYAIAH